MTTNRCPYCGALTDEKICPRCKAAISQPEEKPIKAEAPKKGRKTTKEG